MTKLAVTGDTMQEIAGPAGRLETRLEMPTEAPRAVAVVAPPHPQHGGTLNSKVVYHAAQGLLRAGCAVLRFNYRGVGTSAGSWSGGDGEKDDFRAAIDAAAGRFAELPVWAIGYSFGAHIALTVGAEDARVSQLVGIATVVNGYDYAPLLTSEKPKVLVHGERDHLTSVQAIRRFYGELLEPREIVIVDMADHYFDGRQSEVADTLEDLLAV